MGEVLSIQDEKKKRTTQTSVHEETFTARARKKKRFTAIKIQLILTFEHCMKNTITLIPFLSEFRLTASPSKWDVSRVKTNRRLGGMNFRLFLAVTETETYSYGNKIAFIVRFIVSSRILADTDGGECTHTEPWTRYESVERNLGKK